MFSLLLKDLISDFIFGYLSPMRAAMVQASLRIRAVSPEPPLLAHTSSESRGTFRRKARSLAPLNGWACAVKICHDGMLEDTNSLDSAHRMNMPYLALLKPVCIRDKWLVLNLPVCLVGNRTSHVHRTYQSKEKYTRSKDRWTFRYKFMGRLMPVTSNLLCSTPEDKRPEPRCHCDIDCVLYGDCCVDAFKTYLAITDEQSLIDTIKEPEKIFTESDPYSFESCYKSLYHKYGSCHDLNINNEDVSVSFIDKCPENRTEPVDPLIQNKCVNIPACEWSSVPATLAFSKERQVVFRNIFCALCHGLNEEDVIVWHAYAKCHVVIDLNKTYNDRQNMFQHCKGVFKPPQNVGKLRQCIKERDLHSECNIKTRRSDTNKDSLACPVYLAPVNFNGKQYKNIHCAYCNKKDHTKFDKVDPIVDVELTTDTLLIPFTIPSGPQMPTAQPRTTPIYLPGGDPSKDLPSMKILFDFDFRSGFSFNVEGSSHHFGGNRCKGKGVRYDYISNSCRSIICPFGQEWIRGMCRYEELELVSHSEIYPVSRTRDQADHLLLAIVSLADQLINETVLFQSFEYKLNETFTNYIKGKPNANATEKDSKSIQAEVMKKIIINEQSKEYTYTVLLDIVYDDQAICFHEIVTCIAKFRRLIERGNQIQRSKIQAVSLSNRNQDESYSCNGDRHIRHLMDVTYDIHNNTVYLVNKDVNVAYHARYSRFTFDFLSETSIPIVRDSIICSLLECPQMDLSDGEYTIINNTLRLNGNDDFVPHDKYEIRNETVYVCIPSTHRDDYMPFKHLHSTQIIQRFTYSLSLLALSLTIIIYVKSASLRTLHGKTLVSLSVSLIGANVTSLLETEVSHGFCKAVAIIMHFSWLAAFGWMSMISYDMLRTFFGKQTTVKNSRSDRKRYLLYSITGWFGPGLIVIICIVLDITEISDVLNPAYGKHGGCFIVGKRVRLIFFQVPYAASVLFNTVAFILTVYGISTKRKANPHSKRSKDRIYSLIYLKLSVVMGITWLFAILASITNQPVFWYLHLVLNGSQGVFVFISFSMRASIWKKIKLKKPRLGKNGMKATTFYSISGSPTFQK